MIYVSSSCVHFETIAESVRFLAEEGFKNIELSGGTKLYPALENDLQELKSEFSLNYLCHNYFPPPAIDFVLNLASLNEQIGKMSLDHVLAAIALSKRLGASKYSFHAGFIIDIPIEQIGKSISQITLFDRSKCKEQFAAYYLQIHQQFPEIDLYVENNVLSARNLKNYQGRNPFFITDAQGVEEFSELPGFRPLLDVAHLKVTCQSLNLSFEDQLARFMSKTDYIHISDNDGFADTNRTFEFGSELYDQLSDFDFVGKTISLEVYSGISDLKRSFEAAKKLVNE